MAPNQFSSESARIAWLRRSRCLVAPVPTAAATTPGEQLEGHVQRFACGGVSMSQFRVGLTVFLGGVRWTDLSVFCYKIEICK